MHLNNDRTLKNIFNTKMEWSKKSWKTEIAMGRWCQSRYENIRGQELEEGCP
jgi:hypothetical protein